MPARDEHGHHGFRQRAVLDDVDGDVGSKMVNAIERYAERERQRLGRGHPHHQCSRETWPGRHRDGIEVPQLDPGLAGGPLDRRDHGLKVGPTRHFGHHPTESGVLVNAARDRVNEQGLAADDADAGFVAGRLDPEDKGFLRTHD